MAANKKRSPRKPTLSGTIKQVRRAGVEISRIEIEGGRITIVVDKGDSGGVQRNPWDAEIAKLKATPKGGKGQ